MTVTPEQADRLNKKRTPGNWTAGNSDEDLPNVMAVSAKGGLITGTPITDGVWEDADADLIAAAPDMAELIAGMREQWGVSVVGRPTGLTTAWFDSKEEAEAEQLVQKDIARAGNRSPVEPIVYRLSTVPVEA